MTPVLKNRLKVENLPMIMDADPVQLDNIKAHLDLLLLSLETLVGIGSDQMLKAAIHLKIDGTIADRVALWRLRQSNPLRKSQGGRKKLDVDEARSLVLLICYLAQVDQELIRRAVALLEQLTERNEPFFKVALLGNYIDKFTNTYLERMEDMDQVKNDDLSNLALKLLVDLMFYGGLNGHRRLWLALFDRAKL